MPPLPDSKESESFSLLLSSKPPLPLLPPPRGGNPLGGRNMPLPKPFSSAAASRRPPRKRHAKESLATMVSCSYGENPTVFEGTQEGTGWSTPRQVKDGVQCRPGIVSLCS